MATYDHNPNQVPATADEWTPVLKGETFCSPRCGGGCTKAEYDAALESANTLAARMGHRWEIEVWENLGWHFCVKNGPATVTQEVSGQYQVELCFPRSKVLRSRFSKPTPIHAARSKRLLIGWTP